MPRNPFRVASDQTSQHFPLILGVDEAQDAVGTLVVVVFILLSLGKLTISSTLFSPSAKAIKEATMRSSCAVVVDVIGSLLANMRWPVPLAFFRCPDHGKPGRRCSLHSETTINAQNQNKKKVLDPNGPSAGA